MGTRPLLFFLVMLLLSACSGTKPHSYQKSKALMDTFITITVVSDSEKAAEEAMEIAFRRIGEFGKMINFFSSDSELAMVNKNAGVTATHVSPETLDVIVKALYVAEKSNGAFDPTIGPVMRLWDFHKNIKPEDAEVKRNLPLVNYRNVRIDRRQSTVFLTRKGMLLDLGGIAKGYAADLAVEALKQEGIQAGLVAAAGDIRAFGLRPDRKLWNIGIKNPRQTNEKDEIMGMVRLTDKAISTSGDYERYFISEGRRYHHIIDPRTGYPAGLAQSASIVTEKGVFTDGFSTAVFVLGPEKGMKLVDEINRGAFPIEALIVDVNGMIKATPGLEGALKIEKSH